jgi:hypothetical protein
MGQLILLAVTVGWIWLFWKGLSDKKSWSTFRQAPLLGVLFLIKMVGLTMFLLWISLHLFNDIKFGKIPLGLAGFIAATLALIVEGLVS